MQKSLKVYHALTMGHLAGGAPSGGQDAGGGGRVLRAAGPGGARGPGRAARAGEGGGPGAPRAAEPADGAGAAARRPAALGAAAAGDPRPGARPGAAEHGTGLGAGRPATEGTQRYSQAARYGSTSTQTQRGGFP